MSSTTSQFSNTRVLIDKIPEGVTPNKSRFTPVTTLESAPILKENEIFVKNIVFSMEPYLRLDDFTETVKQSRVVGYAIARVLDSRNTTYPVGALVFSSSEWGEFTHVHEPQTVGQMAGQLAKRKGLRVIGSAGSDAKVEFLTKELGFDAAFNYKTQDKREALTKAVTELGGGLDIYYDLVGDDTVEIALDLLNPYGRVLGVGLLAWHANSPAHPLPNGIQILQKQLRWEGYTVFDRHDLFPEFLEKVGPLVAKGEIKYTDTLLNASVETLGETYVEMLGGKYTGKVSVQIAKF
ncbi:hypothetical protein BG004_006524 [Podila humilis]|nr:hypothetical protein BG004_006524 [Podila humilis]